ncbi:MAG TPA: M20 family metallo-hydrolase [Gemmatimonadaceae bacterium]|nr:M20 family metallo-hydrolase [Gemmatimonadaceae bacterium]
MNLRDFTAAIASATTALALPRVGRGLPPTRAPSPLVNGVRLNSHLAALSEFGRNPQGGVTRLAYSDADRAARAYVTRLMREAKLEVSVDAGANIIGRRAGSDTALKPILFGSHIDSVPEGGNYDGDVGSLGAIEVAQTLSDAAIVTKHPLEVVVFQNEEGGLWGSHAMTADLTAEELSTASRSGKTIREGIAFLGGDPDKLARDRKRRGDYHAYLELHIEQGAMLDREHTNIGIVEGIVGIRQWDVTIDGFANHAGTTAMLERHDALLAAARFIEAVNRVVLSTSGRQVGTVGRIQALPGATNVIPGKVVCSLELRDLDARKITTLFTRIEAEAKKIGEQNGTRISFKQVNENIPAPSDPRIRALIVAAARDLELTFKTMPSGAGHDAQDVAQICPVGMIFVPSAEGISHAPKEFSHPKDIENGANVLLHTLLKLDATSLSA